MKNFEEQKTESYFQSDIQINENFSPILNGNLLYQNEWNQHQYLNQSFENSKQYYHPSTQNSIALVNCNNKPHTAIYYHNDPYFKDLTQHLDSPQQYLMQEEEEQLIVNQSQQQNQFQYQYPPQLNSQNDNIQFDFQSPFQNCITNNQIDHNVEEICPIESIQYQEYHNDHQQTEQNYHQQNFLSLSQTINPSLQSSLPQDNQKEQQISTNCEDWTLPQDSTSMQHQQLEVKAIPTGIEEEEQQYQFEEKQHIQQVGQQYNAELNYVNTIDNKNYYLTNACKVCDKYYAALSGLQNHVKNIHGSKNVQAYAMMLAKALGRPPKILPVE